MTFPNRDVADSSTDQSTRNVVVEKNVSDALKSLLGGKETVEAAATVTAYNMVSRFIVAPAI
ncbi:hypothetical protein [Pectobacterium brasiliense]|uniref:hypothetical protein n=1 Tax=Pectobacterium brasiliense TaxID=180957 RepID=UPI001F080347|nr:hypothetical protein [Pectobacterium brasiliense]